VHEDLLNAVTNLVHRHVLVTLHAMTGAMLAQLDAGGEVDLGGKAPTPEPAKPAVAALSPKPSTVERRARLVRAKQRQAAATAATGETAAPAGHWPVLRTEFHAAIKTRHLSRATVAADLGVSKGSICGWLLPHGAPPSAANITKIRGWLNKPAAPKVERNLVETSLPSSQTTPDLRDRVWPALREQLCDIIKQRALTHADIAGVLGAEAATVGGWLATSHEKRSPGPRFLLKIEAWLREGAVVPEAAANAPLHTLAAAERDRLVGHLSLGNAPELRQLFGCTKELLEKAAAGEHLAGEVIARLRSVLANGAAAK